MGSSRGVMLLVALAMGLLAGVATFYVMEPPPAPVAPPAALTTGVVVADGYTEQVAAAREIAAAAQAGGMPGLAVAVGVDGELVWAEGFGWADLENRVPVTPSSRFRIGSVSKPLTTAALAQLWQDGVLDLDAPVQRYVPAFPEKAYPLTTRLLAGHLAGVRHYRGDEFLMSRHFGSVAEGLEIFANDPLLFEPGTQYQYSSYGWNLISAVMEGASGRQFLPLMQETVLDRLGLRDTAPDQNADIVPHRVRFYEATDGGFVNSPYVDNSYKWAGGGFVSTMADLVRFGSAHLAPGFLQAETLDLLFTSQRTRDGTVTGYGIGWSVREDDAGRRWVGHSGGSVGGSTLLAMWPDDGLVVALASNMSSSPRLPANEIAEVFLARVR